MSNVEIVVDWDGCEANGLCEGAAPEVFHLDDDDMLHVLIERPGDELLDKVNSAVEICPKRAIALKRLES
jgi:ferredoxin